MKRPSRNRSSPDPQKKQFQIMDLRHPVTTEEAINTDIRTIDLESECETLSSLIVESAGNTIINTYLDKIAPEYTASYLWEAMMDTMRGTIVSHDFPCIPRDIHTNVHTVNGIKSSIEAVEKAHLQQYYRDNASDPERVSICGSTDVSSSGAFIGPSASALAVMATDFLMPRRRGEEKSKVEDKVLRVFSKDAIASDFPLSHHIPSTDEKDKNSKSKKDRNSPLLNCNTHVNPSTPFLDATVPFKLGARSIYVPSVVSLKEPINIPSDPNLSSSIITTISPTYSSTTSTSQSDPNPHEHSKKRKLHTVPISSSRKSLSNVSQLNHSSSTVRSATSPLCRNPSSSWGASRIHDWETASRNAADAAKKPNTTSVTDSPLTSSRLMMLSIDINRQLRSRMSCPPVLQESRSQKYNKVSFQDSIEKTDENTLFIDSVEPLNLNINNRSKNTATNKIQQSDQNECDYEGNVITYQVLFCDTYKMSSFTGEGPNTSSTLICGAGRRGEFGYPLSEKNNVSKGIINAEITRTMHLAENGLTIAAEVACPVYLDFAKKLPKNCLLTGEDLIQGVDINVMNSVTIPGRRTSLISTSSPRQTPSKKFDDASLNAAENKADEDINECISESSIVIDPPTPIASNIITDSNIIVDDVKGTSNTGSGDAISSLIPGIVSRATNSPVNITASASLISPNKKLTRNLSSVIKGINVGNKSAIKGASMSSPNNKRKKLTFFLNGSPNGLAKGDGDLNKSSSENFLSKTKLARKEYDNLEIVMNNGLQKFCEGSGKYDINNPSFIISTPLIICGKWRGDQPPPRVVCDEHCRGVVIKLMKKPPNMSADGVLSRATKSRRVTAIRTVGSVTPHIQTPVGMPGGNSGVLSFPPSIISRSDSQTVTQASKTVTILPVCADNGKPLHIVSTSSPKKNVEVSTEISVHEPSLYPPTAMNAGLVTTPRFVGRDIVKPPLADKKPQLLSTHRLSRVSMTSNETTISRRPRIETLEQRAERCLREDMEAKREHIRAEREEEERLPPDVDSYCHRILQERLKREKTEREAHDMTSEVVNKALETAEFTSKPFVIDGPKGLAVNIIQLGGKAQALAVNSPRYNIINNINTIPTRNTGISQSTKKGTKESKDGIHSLTQTNSMGESVSNDRSGEKAVGNVVAKTAFPPKKARVTSPKEMHQNVPRSITEIATSTAKGDVSNASEPNGTVKKWKRKTQQERERDFMKPEQIEKMEISVTPSGGVTYTDNHGSKRREEKYPPGMLSQAEFLKLSTGGKYKSSITTKAHGNSTVGSFSSNGGNASFSNQRINQTQSVSFYEDVTLPQTPTVLKSRPSNLKAFTARPSLLELDTKPMKVATVSSDIIPPQPPSTARGRYNTNTSGTDNNMISTV